MYRKCKKKLSIMKFEMKFFVYLTNSTKKMLNCYVESSAEPFAGRKYALNY